MSSLEVRFLTPEKQPVARLVQQPIGHLIVAREPRILAAEGKEPLASPPLLGDAPLDSQRHHEQQQQFEVKAHRNPFTGARSRRRVVHQGLKSMFVSPVRCRYVRWITPADN
jgi:hypothetical protein